MLTACIMFLSCNKDKTLNSNYLIFGHYFGFCAGEQCREIFKLNSTTLYEDTNDKYPNSDKFYEANYITLSEEKFNLVKDLADDFPTDLLSEKNITIGQPDAGDWGGYYIEYSKNGVHKFWLIDKMTSNVPAKYHAFLSKVEKKIELLQ